MTTLLINSASIERFKAYSEGVLLFSETNLYLCASCQDLKALTKANVLAHLVFKHVQDETFVIYPTIDIASECMKHTCTMKLWSDSLGFENLVLRAATGFHGKDLPYWQKTVPELMKMATSNKVVICQEKPKKKELVKAISLYFEPGN